MINITASFRIKHALLKVVKDYRGKGHNFLSP